MKATKKIDKAFLDLSLMFGLLIENLIDSGVKLDNDIIQFYEGVKPLIDKVRKGEK